MATARKHWFKVADSIARDDLTNDELATLIRLLGMLNTQWARDGLNGEPAARIALRPVDLMACTGSESLARARRIVGACSTKVGLTVDAVGKQTVISWPKCLKFQKWDAPEQGESGEKSGDQSPPPQDARRKTQTKTQDTEGKAADAASRNGRRRAKPTGPDPRAVEVWPAIREAFATHGRMLGENVGADRAALLAKRLDEGHSPEDLVAAVHGYVAGHGGLEPDDRFDPGKYFRVSTVFKADGFSDRVDAGRSPQRTQGTNVLRAFPNVRTGR